MPHSLHPSSQFIIRNAACDYVCFVLIVFDVTLKFFTQLSNSDFFFGG